MTWKDATDALLTHFITRWGTLHASMPIDVPNGKAVSVDVSSESFVRIRFFSSFSERDTVGGQHRSQGGRVLVNTFTPQDQGDGAAVGYDREIESIWETAHANGLDGGIHLNAPEPVAGIEDPDFAMYRSGVTTPFTFDHTP